MSKIDDLIQEFCPDGVEYKPIKKMAEVGTGSSNGNEAQEDGKYPFFIRSQTVKRKNEWEYDEEAIIIPGEGGIGEIYHYVNGKYAIHQRVYRIHFTDNSVDVKFAYHYFRAFFKNFIMRKAVSATVKSIRKPMIEEFMLPVPPLEVQREIVHILDSFTLLTAELTARKKQYEFYRDKLLTFSENKVKYLPLGELYPDIRNGFVGTVTPFFSNKENGVLYLRGTNVHDGVISNEDVVYVSKEFHEKHNRTELKSDDIIMVQSGHVGECAVVGEAYAGANCHALIVMSNGGANMCITEEKLVEAYGNSNPHERFLLIYKNYSVFPQLVDCYETGLFNRILFEVEYNRRKKNDDDLGVRVQTSHLSDGTMLSM